MNEGPQFETNPLDPAEERRLGNMWYVPFLGLEHPEQEVAIVTEKASVSRTVAGRLVDAVNHIRRVALDENDRRIQMGISTSDVIRWAQTAAADTDANLSDAVLRATKSAIIDPRYDELTDEVVRAILTDALTDRQTAIGDGIGASP